ncbi:MAG: tRNA pseudouridine(13) synthase TruD [Nitrososphaerota archaeon]
MLGCGEIEPAMGIEVYYTPTRGVGGIIKSQPEDFILSEILEGGLDAQALWRRETIPIEPTRYTLWILKKRNRETFSAVAELAKTLETRLLKARICGIKDRRAVTYQFVALPLTKISSDGDYYAQRGWEVWRVGYIDELNSSRLVANRFEIIVRGASVDCSTIGDFREAVQSSGVPNFYGHQRFGLLRPITHLVGRCIVKGDLKAAVETFLGYSTQFEPEHILDARRALAETGDIAYAIKHFPRSLTYERRVLRYLNHRPGDYAGALRRLPLRIRRLFVDAYSSYLFNRALSITIRDGLRLDEPVTGDLFVRLDRHQRPYGRPLQVTSWNLEEVSLRISRGEAALVIPRPGTHSWITSGPRGRALKNVLEYEGVSLRDFRARPLPEASSTGTYRPVMLKPSKLEIEKLNDSTVRLSFTLPPAHYATSLLRELMKRGCALSYMGIEHCYA